MGSSSRLLRKSGPLVAAVAVVLGTASVATVASNKYEHHPTIHSPIPPLTKQQAMTLQDLFDQLLDDRVLVVELNKQESESLRVQLSKKWNKYKRDMDACGFLAEDLQQCSLLRHAGETETSTRFTLAPRGIAAIEYTVISVTGHGADGELK